MTAAPGRVPPAALDGLRLAVGLLSVLPVRVTRVDRETAGWAMAFAPAVGLLLGGTAALAGAVLETFTGAGGLLASAIALGLLALLTRGLHLDGLADLADGLGSGRPAGQALDIMKRSDIGPFGVLTLVFTLLVQAAALDRAGPAALVVAAATGRLAVTWACLPQVPPARPEGLGATVAGTVRPAAAAAATAATAVAALLVATLPGGEAWGVTAVRHLLAIAAGLGLAWALRRHAVRRLGGVTGDVFGALVEAAVTAALVTCALTA
ncbi:adenosylcobinamide-GDP ribazoletransferase [Thermopolyspora flexuosa]|uniref:Adenosylcobinamide-GDP ribazoletransferase n=1 Tax=Thermopolyspora flexuosa TaxID=103836 RepID=A0A543J018_9ACTN|nr:adenosylcobinamide-GDP ribazoletransferase [Thermopolyspora flexuosa]TQM76160.1 cobalamin-5'-phosphate synthase [Thermopolyspora flexuosa]GGM65214.1 adenosylcobinamide-GDP ribazoletransferase [Thermopolyspora flexuosa]